MTYPPTPAPAPVGAGRRTLLVTLSAIASSIGALFAVVFTPLAITGIGTAEPLDGAWNEGSNFINVVFSMIFAFGMVAIAILPIVGAILARVARNVGLIIFGTVVSVALVFTAVCGFAAAMVMGSGS